MTPKERMTALLEGWFALGAANDAFAFNAKVQEFHALGPDATHFLLRGIAQKQEELAAAKALLVPPVPPTTVDTAAQLLAQFLNGDTLVKYDYGEEQIDMVISDDQAALLAAQLLVIGQAVTRIAEVLEARL